MFSFKSIVMIAAALVTVESSGVAVPAALSAPLVAPAHFEYAHSVPYNVPPHAAQVNYESRALSPLPVAPVATPFAAPLAPYGRFAAPYLAGQVPSPYAYPGQFAAYAAPYPYAAPYTAPYPFAAPYGAPAFVR